MFLIFIICIVVFFFFFFFFQAEDGIRDDLVTGVQTCALPISQRSEAPITVNLVLTVIGASLLWVGWFGFNAGSAVAADGRAGMAMAVTRSEERRVGKECRSRWWTED